MPEHTTALICTDSFKENCIKDKCSREKNYNKILGLAMPGHATALICTNSFKEKCIKINIVEKKYNKVSSII
jgi:hypothetical protein